MDSLFAVIVIYVLCKYVSVLFPEYTRLWNLIACLLTILGLLGYATLGFRKVN